MNIKILGSGCKNCKTLESNAREAAEQLGLIATFEKVEDFKTIASYGVLKTPGLVVDEKLVASGKVLNVDEIKSKLK
ncbi:thioredoxin family protein [Anoxynatronum buryatiense]|uniref:Small redox-active disulfide protein 2 n=1 Tax=Anoxynatronum buryatiense TaxID=489973 RepID=A0AA45WU62_9CLOT|nr:thioredoxin family protein [Anoxynatronum buryatiense]SMP41669.1 small redox-active disulfide protein 2 [Anoxynatronum buryatiense]